jgi:exopolyphosphatase/guanosine-5'-triphosphate,3'-diphosphate pyrophosphatase
MTKFAIIDMGTNTFHLLIAVAEKANYTIMLRERLAVKIGMGGINQGLITQDGMDRALVAMQSFKNTIVSEGAEKVYAFGTSAFRNAHNGSEVADRIKTITGIEINIISGDKEAEYIYEGVKSALGLGEEKSLIIDIGGGSVEFIIGNHDHIFWKKSLEIGAQRLLERFHNHEPIAQAEVAALDDYFEKELSVLFEALEIHNPAIMVGSSGTFDTLSDIFCIQHDIHKLPEEVETPLTLEGFYEIYHDLLNKNREQRMQTPGMIDMRVDMIVVASCMVRFLLEKHPFNRIRVSTYSLKEGALTSLIHAINSGATFQAQGIR